jgi:hypothetical protein
MAWSASVSRVAGDGGEKSEPVAVLLPDVTHLVLSALVSAGAVADDAGIWGWDISSGGKGVKIQEFTSWVLSTPVGLGNCLSRYVRDRFRSLGADSVEVIKSYYRIGSYCQTLDEFTLYHVLSVEFVRHYYFLVRSYLSVEMGYIVLFLLVFLLTMTWRLRFSIVIRDLLWFENCLQIVLILQIIRKFYNLIAWTFFFCT